MSKTPISEHLKSPDPLSEEALNSLLQHHEEDLLVDYKETVDTDSEKEWLGLTKDAMAFANTYGGYIVFGVRDKSFEVVGLTDDVAQTLSDTNQALQKLNRFVSPEFRSIRSKRFGKKEKTIVAWHIPESEGKTHIITKEGAFRSPTGETRVILHQGTTYTRRSAGNQILDPESLEDIIKRRIEHYGRPLFGAQAPGPLDKEVKAMVDRFIQVYEAHGVRITQLPRLVPTHFGLHLADVSSDASLLPKLTVGLATWTCDAFGVKMAWIEGDAAEMYDTPDFYKNACDFIDLVAAIRKRAGEVKVVALKAVAELDSASDGEQPVGILLKEPIAELNGDPVYRYHPVYADWNWSYWKSRFEFKSLIRVCWDLDIVPWGYDLSPEEITKIGDGKCFPGPVIQKLHGYTWHPEDYVLKPSESLVAKDIEEVEGFLAHFERMGYGEHFRRTFPEIRKE